MKRVKMCLRADNIDLLSAAQASQYPLVESWKQTTATNILLSPWSTINLTKERMVVSAERRVGSCMLAKRHWAEVSHWGNIDER